MSLAYDRQGQGPILVLLHGLGHRRGAWDPLLPGLTKVRDVITVDLPGHGESPPLPAGVRPDLDSLIDALIAFFSELGLHRPHVAGNSLGGLLALELARRGQARSVTALSPAGFWKNEAEFRLIRRKLRALRTSGRLLAPLAPAICRSTLGRTLAFSSVRARGWRLDARAALDDAMAMQNCAHFDHFLSNGVGYAEQPRPRVPVLVAWAARDRILPVRHAVLAQQLLPDARHVLLPGCGHVPITDAPNQVRALILAGSRDDSGLTCASIG